MPVLYTVFETYRLEAIAPSPALQEGGRGLIAPHLPVVCQWFLVAKPRPSLQSQFVRKPNCVTIKFKADKWAMVHETSGVTLQQTSRTVFGSAKLNRVIRLH